MTCSRPWLRSRPCVFRGEWAVISRDLGHVFHAMVGMRRFLSRSCLVCSECARPNAVQNEETLDFAGSSGNFEDD